MSLTIEALNILLLLIPGFLSGQIFYSLFKLGEVPVYRRVLDALLYSFVIYSLISIFLPWEPLAQVRSTGGALSFSFSANTKLMVSALLLAACIPTIVGFLYYNDYIHSLLRKLKITTKTSRGNTWNDAFLTQDRFVIITLKDGRRIRGYPTMFSTDPAEGFIYLFNPAWVNDDKKTDDDQDYFESNCHGFLLNRDNIELIEFTLNLGETLSTKS